MMRKICSTVPVSFSFCGHWQARLSDHLTIRCHCWLWVSNLWNPCR